MLVAVVEGDGLHPVNEVRKAFGTTPIPIEYIIAPNDPVLREVVTFPLLLDAIKSTDYAEATFYAHTKGNSTADSELGSEFWRNAMYHHLLDHVEVCRDLLMSHPCVGTHKLVWKQNERSPFPSKLNVGCWMYAGTYFWFRHKDVFSTDKWCEVPKDRYGAEAWLSTLFHPDDAATVFQPWMACQYPLTSPYEPSLYRWPIRDP